MNNLRKIGLSALAGSLATFSSHAAEFSVSGGASITFDDPNREKVTKVTASTWVIVLDSMQVVKQTAD